MMQKILNTEEVMYASNLNEAHLMQRIEALFGHTSLRLAGKLISKNEFTAYDKLIVIGWDMPNLKRKAAYLYGKITKGEKGTMVKLKVNPNSILPVFAILATLIGVMITLVAFSNTGYHQFFLIMGLVFMALGVIYYPVSTFLRNRLRNKLVKYLDLIKV